MSTLQDLLQRVIDDAGAAGSFDFLGLAFHDDDADVMRVGAVSPPGIVFIPSQTIPVSFGPAGAVWRSQEMRVFKAGDETAPPFMVEMARRGGLHASVWMPLSTATKKYGVLVFATSDPDGHPEQHLDVLTRMTAQVAFYIENDRDMLARARLDPDASEASRAELLLEITNAVASELDLKRLLRRISRLLSETIAHHFVSLTLWDEQAGQLRRHAMVFPDRAGVLQDEALVQPRSPAAIAFERGTTMVFRWADVEALGDPARDVMQRERLRSVACLLLRTPRAVHGTLNIGRPDDYLFPAHELLLLERLAQQMAIAIENAIHFQAAERYRLEATAQRDRLRLLLDVNNALVTEHQSRSLPQGMLQIVREQLPHDYASLSVFDRDSHELRVETMTYYDERGVMTPQIVAPLGRSPSGITFLSQTPRLFTFDELRQLDVEGSLSVLKAGITSMCCVPLTTQRGVIGTLNLGRRDSPFTDAELALVCDVGRQVAIAVENTLAFQEISELRDRLAEEKLYLEEEITARHDFMGIVGSSPQLAAVIQQVRTVGPTDATVLLLGETGTGKELLARALHESSPRRTRTFVRLNGAALPSTLVESELFGYEKGAFTGAAQARAGRLELAHRGTLFIDEVGDIGLDVQPKLLRALQEREFERLGSTRTHHIDVRLIAATNRDLEDMVRRGQFRSDLFYRLNVFPIRIPPLRERVEDIAPLTRHFVQKFSREMGRQITTIPSGAMEALERWHWPGNIRELENVIERAVILSPGDTLQVPLAAIQVSSPIAPSPARASASELGAAERDQILAALRDANGVVGSAATRLGMKRTTLHSRMRKLGIERPSF